MLTSLCKVNKIIRNGVFSLFYSITEFIVRKKMEYTNVYKIP